MGCQLLHVLCQQVLSVTCSPLRSHARRCCARAGPYPDCHVQVCLGPTSALKSQGQLPLSLHHRGGCTGPLAADLSNRTRRASRQYPAPPGPTRCRGAQGICPLSGPGPGPHIARWAARCAAAAGLQPAKHAAGGLEPTPGRCCGLGPRALRRASPSHRTGDWAHVPARTALAGMFVTDPQTARGLRLVYYALPSTTTVLAQVSRSRCKLWPRLRSAKAPWGFLRVRL